MAGRSPAEAVTNFVQPLQRALSCVTSEVLSVGGGYYPTAQPHVLLLGRGAPAPLAGQTRVALSLFQRYRIVEDEGPRGPWKVTTVAYYYALEDAEGRELVAYHWHPTDHAPVTSPHLHLGPGAQVGRADLAKAHIPTGRVAIEEVLLWAISELGVRPLRDDWREVLDEGLEAFRLWRTWA